MSSIRSKGIGSAVIVMIVIVIVVGGVGGYLLIEEYGNGGESKEYDELEPGEHLLTENIAELGIKT